MTNTEILLNAIEKAKDNGYPAPLERNISLLMATYPMLIFSHDFAKAFWGELKIECIHCKKQFNTTDDFLSESHAIECRRKHFYGNPTYNPISLGWQYHLQQMVLEKEPLKYLSRFLND